MMHLLRPASIMSSKEQPLHCSGHKRIMTFATRESETENDRTALLEMSSERMGNVTLSRREHVVWITRRGRTAKQAVLGNVRQQLSPCLAIAATAAGGASSRAAPRSISPQHTCACALFPVKEAAAAPSHSTIMTTTKFMMHVHTIPISASQRAAHDMAPLINNSRTRNLVTKNECILDWSKLKRRLLRHHTPYYLLFTVAKTSSLPRLFIAVLRREEGEGVGDDEIQLHVTAFSSA